MVQEIYPGADMEAVRNRPFIKNTLKENVKMFTAKDLHEKIKQSGECPNIDFWIEHTLVDKFKTNPNNVTISHSILNVNNWTRVGFIDAMNQRGFSVKHVPDQRDGDYYSITYPTQGR